MVLAVVRKPIAIALRFTAFEKRSYIPVFIDCGIPLEKTSTRKRTATAAAIHKGYQRSTFL